MIETKKVIKQCKQAEACFNLKMKNFRKKVVNSECKPAAKKGNLTSKLYLGLAVNVRSLGVTLMWMSSLRCSWST